MSLACMPSYSFIPLMVSEKIFKYFFFENLPPKLSGLDKSHMKRWGLLNKHFCKKNSNIPNETAEIANFPFLHYKSMVTIRCHSNQSSYPIGTKTQLFVPHT